VADNSDGSIIGPFKNFILLDHIVDGGMGAIYRAKYSDDAIGKIVVIKMIKDRFSRDEEFKKLFLNEIKVTFPLQHPNVCQTYEYGEYDEKLYAVLEYVEGRNLKEYLKRLNNLGFAFPIEVAMYITSEICKGLHYAHTLTDKLTGKCLNIIHRDISPHNIMLTFDGAVKVIDFGIAKADTNEDKTQTGVIKGKISYMAPEYLEGKQIDYNYDQFATGIVLWEMLCNQQLFKGKSDLEKMLKITEKEIPLPSSINKRVPKELDDIVLRSLSKDKDSRFENLDQMNRAITRLLFEKFPNFNPSDLKVFGEKLFAKEIAGDRQWFRELNEMGLFSTGESGLISKPKPTSSANVSAPSLPPSEPKKPNVSETLVERIEQKAAKAAQEEQEAQETQEAQSEQAQHDPDKIVISSELAVDTEEEQAPEKKEAKASPKNTNTTGSIPSVPKKKTPVIREEEYEYEEEDEDEDDDDDEESSLLSSILIPSIIIIALAYGAYHYSNSQPPSVESDREEDFYEGRQMSRQEKIELGKDGQGKVEQKVKIKIANYTPGSEQLFVNGMKTRPNSFNEVIIPSKGPVYIRVEKVGYENFVHMIESPSKTNVELIEIPQMSAQGYGFLNAGASCPKGTLHFEHQGEPRVEAIPSPRTDGQLIFPMDVNGAGESVATSYELEFKNSSGEARSISFTINEDFEEVDLCSLL
jgi:serine/threonine-protein kinase